MIGTRGFRASIYAIAATFVCAGVAIGKETSGPLAFVASDQGGFTFDTGVLRGTLCPKGRPQGLSSVIHIPTGTKMDRGMGLVGHYRVFTTNKRYGTAAWDWSGSSSTLLPDGAVRTVWPATEDRPFELAALYRWRDPQTIDLETTVTAQKDLGQFESFVACYFDETFPTPLVYVGENPEAQGKPGFLGAKKAAGDWQMFPRDPQAETIIRDGRWKLEPNPVNWTLRPYLAAPLALRSHITGGVTAVLMAPASDCFAIATPHEGETHYSLYASRFGRDIQAGETAKARTRLVITGEVSSEQALALYKKYMSDLSTLAP